MSALAKRNTQRSALIIEQCVRNGITTFAIAPGSRSTPLTLAAANHPDTTTKVHFDERGLSFWALGHAKASGKPVAIITTSGTAVANCFPALCEANLTHVPLLMISADRPEELHEIGANQTMNQESIFGEHVRASKTLPISDEVLCESTILSEVQDAIDSAQKQNNPGPVHINCQIREPLYAPQESVREDIQRFLKEWEAPSKRESIKKENTHEVLEVSEENLIRSLKKENGVFLVGDVSEHEAQSILSSARALKVPIIADIQSGLRHLSADRDLLKAVDWALVFGSRFVSKALLGMIKDTSSKQIWVSPHSSIQNPTTPDFKRWSCTTNAALKWCDEHLEPRGVLVEPAQIEPAHTFYDECIQTISKSRKGATFIGNSSIVRRCDSFWTSNEDVMQSIYTNRGVSGIDGNIGTVVGIAEGGEEPVKALLGDITTLHDMASLSMLSESKVPITLIVFNDKGGRIFERLPVAEQTDRLEDMFLTPHNIDVESLMKAHHIPYYAINTKSSRSELEKLLGNPLTKCIEIRLYD